MEDADDRKKRLANARQKRYYAKKQGIDYNGILKKTRRFENLSRTGCCESDGKFKH